MRARSFLTTLVSLAAALVPAAARSSTGDRVLVVLGPDVKQESYSGFFGSLEQRGYELTFSKPGNELLLEAFGLPLHDHLIVFAPETEKFGKHVSPQHLFEAQGKYLNTLYVLSPDVSEAQRALLEQYDVQTAPSGYQVQDAFSHVAGHESCCVVLPPGQSSISPILSPASTSKDAAGPIVYPHGTSFVTGKNPLLLDVLRAPETSFVADKDGNLLAVKPGHVVKFAGDSMSVVAALQTRANTRIGFVGSPALLSDKWWGKQLDRRETGNRAVMEDFTKWLFQETGVVRVVETTHHRAGETEPRDSYRKKDEVTYAITLQEHKTVAGNSSWVPFQADDLQLEFTMLDPHVRTALKKSKIQGDAQTYETTFMAPDRHGVFKFVVNYYRPGWSFVETADRASVVPLRHDEHPRWITGAYPFYAGALSTSAAFLFFTALWMHIGEGDKNKKKAE